MRNKALKFFLLNLVKRTHLSTLCLKKDVLYKGAEA